MKNIYLYKRFTSTILGALSGLCITFIMFIITKQLIIKTNIRITIMLFIVIAYTLFYNSMTMKINNDAKQINK